MSITGWGFFASVTRSMRVRRRVVRAVAVMVVVALPLSTAAVAFAETTTTTTAPSDTTTTTSPPPDTTTTTTSPAPTTATGAATLLVRLVAGVSASEQSAANTDHGGTATASVPALR